MAKRFLFLSRERNKRRKNSAQGVRVGDGSLAQNSAQAGQVALLSIGFCDHVLEQGRLQKFGAPVRKVN